MENRTGMALKNERQGRESRRRVEQKLDMIRVTRKRRQGLSAEAVERDHGKTRQEGVNSKGVEF